MGMIFLSFLFFILIMVTWKADNSPRSDNPNETYYSCVHLPPTECS